MRSTKVDTGIAAVRCAECAREVDELTGIAERWGYWSDGVGELVPFCPECAKREFVAAVETEAKPRNGEPAGQSKLDV